jgi:hypothetical protein
VARNRGIRVNFFVINLLNAKNRVEASERRGEDRRDKARDEIIIRKEIVRQLTTKCVNKQHSKIQLTAFNCNC